MNRPFISRMSRLSCVPTLLALACLVLINESGSASPTKETPQINASNVSATQGMVLIPGGQFMMGSDKQLSRPDEKPAHWVKVDPFWIDTTEVTNAQFKSFVEVTHYVTTAETPPRMEDIMVQLPPGSEQPPAESLKPGSLVCAIPKGFEYWWQWVNGADWRHPEGPLSNIDGKEDYPVVRPTLAIRPPVAPTLTLTKVPVLLTASMSVTTCKVPCGCGQVMPLTAFCLLLPPVSALPVWGFIMTTKNKKVPTLIPSQPPRPVGCWAADLSMACLTISLSAPNTFIPTTATPST